MSRKLPLIFGYKGTQEEATLGTVTPKEYNDLKALPNLEEKLKYFNKNICSLAISGKQVAYFCGEEFEEEPLEIYDSDFSTEADKAIFEPLREQEIARLLDGLGQWKTYGEQLAYIIKQPGFSLYGLTISDRRNEYIIDLRPNKRSPEEITQFNWLSERVFRKSCSPKNHKHFRFHEQRKQIEAQLKNALEPTRVVDKYLEQIEAYTGYPKPYTGKHVKTEDTDMEEYLKKLSLTNGEYNLKAKQVFLKLVDGDFQIQPDFSKKPLYYWDWDVLKHGEQIYQLYKWLKTEAIEKPDPYTITYSSENSLTFKDTRVFFPFDCTQLSDLLFELRSKLISPTVGATDVQTLPISIFEKTELKHYPDLAGWVYNIIEEWTFEAKGFPHNSHKEKLFNDFLSNCEERAKALLDKKTEKAGQTFKAPAYALYHWLMIEMGREPRFLKDANDQLPARRIKETALERYPGKVGKDGQTFYRAFAGIDPAERRVWEKMITLNKPKLIAISGNAPDVIEYLKGFPD